MHPPRVYTCSPSWTPLPPPFPYHPSGSSQCTSPKHPVSCIEPGLAIHFLYDIIHASMPFSQIIPRSLSHRVQKTVLYICVSFAVLYHLSHQGSSYCNYQSDVLLVVQVLWQENQENHLLIWSISMSFNFLSTIITFAYYNI